MHPATHLQIHSGVGVSESTIINLLIVIQTLVSSILRTHVVPFCATQVLHEEAWQPSSELQIQSCRCFQKRTNQAGYSFVHSLARIAKTIVFFAFQKFFEGEA